MSRVFRARFGALAGVASAAATGLAQGFPGAKPDPSTSFAQPAAGGIGPLFNVLLALGIVYAILRFAMPKVMSRLNKRLVTGTGSAIRIEESASFAGGSLYVVSARGKTLLLAVGSQGVQNLADLTEATSAPVPPTFGEIVEKEMERSPKAVAADPRPSAVSPESDWAVALERLEKLAS